MTFRQARENLRKKRSAACLDAYKSEVPPDGPRDARGYFLKGLVLEYGADGIPVDLAGAIDCYRRASCMAQDLDASLLLGIARVLMKKEPENGAAALACIHRARAARHTPEVDLAYARYFELQNDFDPAKRFYLKAALRGRFAGFFGLASVLRRDGCFLQAAVVDIVRLLSGPLLFVVIGKTARNSFEGY